MAGLRPGGRRFDFPAEQREKGGDPKQQKREPVKQAKGNVTGPQIPDGFTPLLARNASVWGLPVMRNSPAEFTSRKRVLTTRRRATPAYRSFRRSTFTDLEESLSSCSLVSFADRRKISSSAQAGFRIAIAIPPPPPRQRVARPSRFPCWRRA